MLVVDGILGETAREVPLLDRSHCQQAVFSLVTQARRSLYVWSRDLEHRIYDVPELVMAVKQLACRSRYSQVRFLIHEPRAVTQQGHRLLELSQRLSSRVLLRQVAEDYQAQAAAFLIVDDMGLLMRPLANRYEGWFNFKTPLQAREKALFFNEVWEKSQCPAEFRRL